MAGTAITYSEITILDLLDTATYIYYSANLNGSGATKVPEANSKYIGIYSGPALENGQPDTPPAGTIWSRYVGQDGQPGEEGEPGSGFYRIITKLRRFTQSQWNQYNSIGHSENWTYQTDEDTPTSNLQINSHIKPGDTAYVLGVVTDRKNIQCMLIGTVTQVTNNGITMTTTSFIVGNDGADGQDGIDGVNANAYILDSNQEEVLKFARTSTQTNPTDLSYYFSPSSLDFILYKLENEVKISQNITNFEFFLKSLGEEVVQLTQENNYLFLSNGRITFNIDGLLLKTSPSQEEIAAKNLLNLESCIIQVKILDENDKWLTEKSLPVRYGLSSEMATFALHAGGINAAIQQSGLSFDAAGLHIKNGGFEILDDTGSAVLKAHRDGNLEIKGSGTFTGTVYASNGKFSGEIEASSGTIGGLQISKNHIQSDNYVPGISGYRLDNEEGVIYAESIEIGTNATISNQLKIGDNCYISNPNINEGNFISIKNENNENIFNLDNKGIVKIGDGIILDGNNSEIKDTNETWRIKPNEAIFNNITAKGVIKTAVFEQGEVQAVGGMILVRPSTIIEKCWLIEGTNIYVIKPKTSIQTQQGNYCEIKRELYIVNSVDEDGTIRLSKVIQGQEASQTLPVNETLIEHEYLKGELLIDYGKEGDVAIAINSSDNSSAMPLQAISVVQNSFQNNMRQSSAKIVLGKMDGTYGGLTGYGLYADNVFLKGQLISEGGTGSSSYYSGIHTSSGVDMPNNGYFAQQTGKIVIWAGARSSDSDDIRNSPFKVDTYGNMYAGSGYFEGSVISKATISAAKMQTAILEGWDSSSGSIQNAALTITADNAINFCGKTGENSKMQLTKDRLWLNIPLHINDFIEGNIDGSLKTYSANKKDYASLKGPSLKFSCEDNSASEISFSKDGLDFSMSDSTIVRMTATQMYVSENFQCGKNINYGNIMEYRQFVSGDQVKGYDLYIKE